MPEVMPSRLALLCAALLLCLVPGAASAAPGDLDRTWGPADPHSPGQRTGVIAKDGYWPMGFTDASADESGRLVVSGYGRNMCGGRHGYLARYAPDGTWDADFDINAYQPGQQNYLHDSCYADAYLHVWHTRPDAGGAQQIVTYLADYYADFIYRRHPNGWDAPHPVFVPQTELNRNASEAFVSFDLVRPAESDGEHMQIVGQWDMRDGSARELRVSRERSPLYGNMHGYGQADQADLGTAAYRLNPSCGEVWGGASASAGEAYVSGQGADDTGDCRPFVARLAVNGELDPGFGTGGILRTDKLAPRSKLIGDGTGVIAAGQGTVAGRQAIELRRLRADGTFSSSFGAGGVTYLAVPDADVTFVNATRWHDGRLLVAARTDSHTFIWLLEADGTVDTGWGEHGRIARPAGSASWIGVRDLVASAGRVFVVSDDHIAALEGPAPRSVPAPDPGTGPSQPDPGSTPSQPGPPAGPSQPDPGSGAQPSPGPQSPAESEALCLDGGELKLRSKPEVIAKALGKDACLHRTATGAATHGTTMSINGIEIDPVSAHTVVRVDGNRVSASGPVKVSVGPLPLGTHAQLSAELADPQALLAGLAASASRGQGIGALSYEGGLTAGYDDKSVTVEMNVSLTRQLRASGSLSAKVKVSVDRVESASIGGTRQSISFGPRFAIENFGLDWDGPRGVWTARGTWEVPFARIPGLTVIGQFDRDLRPVGLGAGVGDPSGQRLALARVPVGPGIGLQFLEAQLGWSPSLLLAGKIGLGFAPTPAGQPWADWTGSLKMIWPYHDPLKGKGDDEPFTVQATGEMNMIGLDRVAKGTLDMQFADGPLPTKTTATGQIDITARAFLPLEITGKLKAVNDVDKGLSAEASGEATLKIALGGGVELSPKVDAQASIDSEAFTFCALKGLFSYRRTLAQLDKAKRAGTLDAQQPSDVPACSFAAPRDPKLDLIRAGARAAQASSPRPVSDTFTVPAGLPKLGLVLHGAADAPNATLITPSGRQLTLPAKGQSVDNAQVSMLRVGDRAYFAVAAPEPGTWTLRLAADSVPVVRALEYRGLAMPKVTARVTGSGARRAVRYQVRDGAGHRIRLVELSPTVRRTIATVRDGAGRLPLRPTAGRAQRRRIVAVIEHAGQIRQQRTVARFRHSGARAIATPRKLKVKLSAGQVTVTWRKVAAARRYETWTTDRHGRRARQTVRAAKLTVARGPGMRVSVIAVDRDGRRSRPAAIRVPAR